MKPSLKFPRSGSIAAILTLNASLALAQAPFTEVTDTGDLGRTVSNNMGAACGDYDGDGDIDLFIGNSFQEGNMVFRNDGSGRFTRMTSAEIGELADDAGDTSAGLWADIDNDGDLDLYVVNYSEATEQSDRNHPGASAQADRLYLNDGTGRFTLTAMPGLSEVLAYSAGANLVDYDADGLLDVFIGTFPIVSGYSGPDFLFHNEGGLSFSQAELPNVSIRSHGSSWVDYDGDGDLDALVNSWRRDYKPVIYRNVGGEAEPQFEVTRTFENGQILGDRASHHAWGDYDNDGDLDLFIKNGSLGNADVGGSDLWTNLGDGAFERRNFFSDPDLGSSDASWIDYDNDGDLDLVAIMWWRDDSHPEDNGACMIYQGDGRGTFIGHRLLEPAPEGVFRDTLTTGDFDNDGFMDVFVPHDDRISQSPNKGRDRLLRNDGNSNHWLKLVLKGTVSNGSAIGAVVHVQSTIRGAETWQMRQVMSCDGSTSIQHDMRPNFGLGDATVAEIVRIEWPSGTVQELTDVPADQILKVVEPPRLRLEAGNELSWPAAAEGFELESAPSVNGPWTTASETIVTQGDRMNIGLDGDDGPRFYRLRQP